MSARRLGLALDALDVLFFRDGRPFGASSRAEGGLPTPRTIAGAFRTRLVSDHGVNLRTFAELRRSNVEAAEALHRLGCPEWIVETRFQGPWLARKSEGKVEPLVPVPQTLFRDGDQFLRAYPWKNAKIPGWRDADRLPLWHRGGADAKPAGGFLTSTGLRTFLEGQVPNQRDFVSPLDLFAFDERTGIAIDPDAGTAEASMIYGVRMLALRKNVCLYVECIPGEGATAELTQSLAGPLALGGEGRHVEVQVLEQPFSWPKIEPEGTGSLWLLTTPALVNDAQQPIKANVRAAATAAPLAVSGWDVARNGPEPTRFAVPAGAVYFVEGDFSPPQGSFSTGEDAAQGWGVALRGRWNCG